MGKIGVEVGKAKKIGREPARRNPVKQGDDGDGAKGENEKVFLDRHVLSFFTAGALEVGGACRDNADAAITK
jgi:hypothetical protein